MISHELDVDLRDLPSTDLRLAAMSGRTRQSTLRSSRAKRSLQFGTVVGETPTRSPISVFGSPSAAIDPRPSDLTAPARWVTGQALQHVALAVGDLKGGVPGRLHSPTPKNQSNTATVLS